jgi:hypothetical protein
MGLLKTCILALSAITANAWDAAEKEAALKVVDECARGVQWWIFQSVADRIADESVAAPPARREPARPSAHPARRRAQRLRRATSETGRGARERPARPSRHAAPRPDGRALRCAPPPRPAPTPPGTASRASRPST